MAILIILNEKMDDIMEIVKFLLECGLLIKRVSETIKNEAKEQKGGFLGHVFRYIRCYFIRTSIYR